MLQKRIFFALVWLWCVLLNTSANASSNAFNAGVIAYQNQRYAEAEAFWLKIKEGRGKDYVAAAYNLAILYENGHGLFRYDGADLVWYKRAANSGSAAAQFNLGGLYYHGKRVPRNINDAIFWWAQAANQGHTDAQYNLAVLLTDNKHIPRDPVRAQSWLILAAENGHFDASVLLDTVNKEINDSIKNSDVAELPSDWHQQEKLWLFSQDPNDYSLELERLDSLEQVRIFIRTHQLQGVAHVYEHDTQFVVVSGMFNTGNDARNAITQLSESLQSIEPFARKLANIQEELRGN
jgi:hypothetical protein